ncbi:MAG: HlyD family type I secretion periplasmic adaptor subunit [Ferrovum myxofaciens]|nr:type I secretion system membrane fusion protein PrsE [Ferrovum myxofaciens]MBW8028278.1 HlyD family type I secretion periplasmic adaptor subunit [Ferrovum sp.]QKE42272.1 MAG: HlyD family type I secretion periplasmic adaptor subunit [Ferrovum myxofaciens]
MNPVNPLSHKKLEIIDATAVEIIKTDDRVYTRMGWWIVLGGVGGFLLWAIFAPLDQGVAISGIVEVATNRKQIQYQPGGIVEAILVKEGDTVKAGQVLVRMNDTLTKAQAEMSRTQYDSDLAVEARLEAERDGKATVRFPQALLDHQDDDPRVKDDMALQQQLFTARRSALQNELSAMDENIAGLEQQAAGLELARSSRTQQLQYLTEQIDNMRDLVKEGYVAKSRFLDLQRNQAEVNGILAEESGRLGYTQRQAAEMKLKKNQRLEDFRKEVRQQLTDVEKEAITIQHRLSSQDFDQRNTEVKSPVDGTVVDLKVFTQGGVVSPGAPMMEVVPSHDALIIEGKIPLELIDKMHPGLEVDMTFPAFNRNTTPHVPGRVIEISADRLTDQKTGQSYYTMRAEVTKKGVRLLGNLQVRPGMPVEAFIKTGNRTMMSYLLKPLFDRIKTSMSEE